MLTDALPVWTWQNPKQNRREHDECPYPLSMIRCGDAER